MDSVQEMYYVTTNDNNFDNTRYYLVNHREKRWCIIPKEYHGLAKNLYGLHLNCSLLNYTIEDKTKDYELVELDRVGGGD